MTFRTSFKKVTREKLSRRKTKDSTRSFRHFAVFSYALYFVVVFCGWVGGGANKLHKYVRIIHFNALFYR